MKNKEKMIMYIWLVSLVVIVLIGIIFCLQRPPAEIVQANKDIVETAGKIRAYYRRLPDYWGLNNAEAVKNNLYVGVITNNQIMNGLKKPVIIGADINGNPVMPGQHSFMIGYRDLNRDECVSLMSFRWQEQDKLGLLSVTVLNDDGTYEFSWGDKGLPLSRSRAKQYCRDKNHIMWSFE